jgi:hypothetical protein
MPASPWTLVVLAVAQAAPVADDAAAIRALSGKDPARIRAAIRHVRERGPAAAAVPLLKLLYPPEDVESPLEDTDHPAAWCALVEVASESEKAPPELVAAVLSACARPGEAFSPPRWFRHLLCNCPPRHLAAALAEFRKTAVRATGSYELFQSFGPDRHPPTELLVAERRRRLFADGPDDNSLIEVLGRIGPEAAAAAPELRRLLRAGNNLYSAREVAVALWRITGERGPLLQMLIEEWRRCRRWPPYDTGIAEVGQMLGELAEPGTLPMLLAGLSSQEADVREAAAIGLGGFGPKASAAVPLLKRLVGDPSPAVRRAAAEALRKIETRGNR